MGKSSKAPDYANSTIDTGLYGTVTTNGRGTTYNPTDFQTSLINSVENAVPNSFNNYFNGGYDNQNFQNYLNTQQNQQANAYDNAVYSQLANRGLMRNAGLAKTHDSFANVMNNQTADAFSNWRTNQLNQMSNLMNVYGVPYGMIQDQLKSSQDMSKSVSDYNSGLSSIQEARRQENNKNYADTINNLNKDYSEYLKDPKFNKNAK